MTVLAVQCRNSSQIQNAPELATYTPKSKNTLPLGAFAPPTSKYLDFRQWTPLGPQASHQLNPALIIERIF